MSTESLFSFPLSDTHAHVGIAEATPPGEPFYPAETLLTLMDRHNVRSAVLIPYLGLTNNSYIARCSTQHRDRFVAVAYVNWDRADACDQLIRLCQQSHFSGIRLQTQARSPGRDPLLIWKTADALGLRISAQGGRSPAYWAEYLCPVLKELPDLSVRIEHLARPQVGLGVNNPAFQSVLRLADFSHVVINIDGLWAVSVEGPPYNDVWPFVEAAFTSFGPERMMWGSDFPYLLEVQRYEDSYGEIAQRLAGLSASARQAIFLDTAERFWGIGPPE